MIRPLKFCFVCVAAASLAGLSVSSSFAGPHAIKCVRGYQIVKGIGPIATPYCQDNLVAQVAREHGIKVTDREIRLNPNTKNDVCIVIGSDIRVTQACSGYTPDGGSNIID